MLVMKINLKATHISLDIRLYLFKQFIEITKYLTKTKLIIKFK